MFSHVTLGTNDPARARPLYDALFAVLGRPLFFESPDGDFFGYGTPAGRLFICRPFDGKAAGAGNGTHVALDAPTRQMVRDAYTAAIAAGAQDEGPPGERPHYHEHYYGAYFRDLDGNKLQVVCHLPVSEAGV